MCYMYICYLYLYMYICVCQMEIKALEHFLWALYVSLICVLICADGDQGAGTLSVGPVRQRRLFLDVLCSYRFFFCFFFA